MLDWELPIDALMDMGALAEALAALEDVVAALAQPVNAPAARAALIRIDIQMRFMVVPFLSTMASMIRTQPELLLKVLH